MKGKEGLLVSLAILMKPQATSSTLMFFPVSALTALASVWSADLDASTSSGSFAFGPKIFGKYSGRRRPKTRLASVMAGGPPLR